MKKILNTFVILTLVSFLSQAQTVWTSTTSGAWSSASTWTRTGSGGGTSATPPASLGNNQRVVITSGHTVTQSSSDLELNGSARLTIENGGKLNMGNNRGITTKHNNCQFNINNGTYENTTAGSGGNVLLEKGTFNWKDASVFISGNLDFKTDVNGSMDNICLRVKQNSKLEGLGSSSNYTTIKDVYWLTGVSNTGNFTVKSSSYINATNWRIVVGSNSGYAEFENSTITGSIFSIYANDELITTSLSGNPSLANYCTDKITGGLGAYSGTKTNSCAIAQAQSCVGIPSADADGDGIIDDLDDYPNDVNRAFNSPYPSTGYATLMFEDLWPFKGDYDFNDLVIDYKYNTITNGLNQVVEVKYTFVLKAIGAGLRNGFGFQLDNIAPDKITSVSTITKTNNVSWLTLNANGTEAGQTFANVVLYDNVYKSLQWSGIGQMVNVYLDGPNANPYVTPDTTEITITFLNNGVAPSGGVVTASELPSSAFNPYLICGEEGSWNQLRNKEIHLPNRVPTSKANTALFGTEHDDSNPATGKYYKTAENLPWAIEVFEAIPYMQEKQDISTGYNNFIPWAESNGSSFTSWFTNSTGNRNNANLYIRP
ncbi:MAG: LruC domain-containing protein [Bacteroidia bacterium]|nr:LruC domain-containing protein [Bacteroidia bacterium]